MKESNFRLPWLFLFLIAELLSLGHIHLRKVKQTGDCIQVPICLTRYMKGAIKIYDKDFLNLLKEKYLYRPTEITRPILDELFFPPWSSLMDWDVIQDNLLEFFTNWNKSGIFVEVGAVDGFFMSQTLVLENKLNWTGLLIEPDTRSFEKLLQSKRNATYCPFCVIYSLPASYKFWQRTIDDNLPTHFKQILSARSVLSSEVLDGDGIRGKTLYTPCAPLSMILIAADMRKPDLISIATGREEVSKIYDVLHGNRIEAKTLLIHFPYRTQIAEPVATIPGYIEDAGRSKSLTKFFIKKSFCQLIDDEKCFKIDHYLMTEACHTYKCFNNITVHVTTPEDVKQKLKKMETKYAST